MPAELLIAVGNYKGQWGIKVKTYSPCGAKATVVYDAASNCSTSAYKENKNV